MCITSVDGEEETGAPLFFAGGSSSRLLFYLFFLFLTSKCFVDVSDDNIRGDSVLYIGKPWTSFQLAGWKHTTHHIHDGCSLSIFRRFASCGDRSDPTAQSPQLLGNNKVTTWRGIDNKRAAAVGISRAKVSDSLWLPTCSSHNWRLDDHLFCQSTSWTAKAISEEVKHLYVRIRTHTKPAGKNHLLRIMFHFSVRIFVVVIVVVVAVVLVFYRRAFYAVV